MDYRKITEGLQAKLRTIVPDCMIDKMEVATERGGLTVSLTVFASDLSWVKIETGQDAMGEWKRYDLDDIGRGVAEFVDGATHVKTVAKEAFTRQGAFGVSVVVFLRVPPAPTQTVYPDLRPDPVTVAPATMRLLRALADGADLQVVSRYHVPYPTLDGEPVSPVDWETFMDDLTTQAQGQFFDGYDWLRFGVTLHSYIDLENVENTEEYLLDRIVLNDAGRAFVAKEPAHE